MLREFDAVYRCLKHIREGRERIARQEALIRRLRNGGYSTKSAETVLGWMTIAQGEFEKNLPLYMARATERYERAMALARAQTGSKEERPPDLGRAEGDRGQYC